MAEEQEQVEQVETPQEQVVDTSPTSIDEEGTIKLDMSKLANPPEVPEAPEVVEAVEVVGAVEEVMPEPLADAQEETILEEIIEEEAQVLAEEIQEAVEQEQQTGAELPDNIQKVVDFINETSARTSRYSARRNYFRRNY